MISVEVIVVVVVSSLDSVVLSLLEVMAAEVVVVVVVVVSQAEVDTSTLLVAEVHSSTVVSSFWAFHPSSFVEFQASVAASLFDSVFHSDSCFLTGSGSGLGWDLNKLKRMIIN